MVKVISVAEKAGYKLVVCLSSDNNRINGNMFAKLCGGNRQSSAVHPCDSTRFFLFDSVGIIKYVRNNWFNQKDNNQTLTYPDVTDPSVVHKASVRVLKQAAQQRETIASEAGPVTVTESAESKQHGLTERAAHAENF